jgi:hypothetical protein
MDYSKIAGSPRAATLLGIAASYLFVLSAQSAQAEEMLCLYQRHKALGDIEVQLAEKFAKVTQKNGLTFVIAGPTWDVSVFQPRKKKIARLTYANFIRNGPKHIEYFDGATDWPLVVEKSSTEYKGLPAKAYALPFKSKDGKIVSLKHGKVGSYYVNTTFKVDPHIRNFLFQMFHLQPADGIPLKYVKLGKPHRFGQDLAYNRSEVVVTALDTMTAKSKPFQRNIFAVPGGYKTTTESDITFGDKTDDLREIMEDLN